MRAVAVGRRDELPIRLLNSMHRFRHDVFIRRLGWSVQPAGSKELIERDEYDTADAVYLVISDEDERVIACARLLASTGPYMLRTTFRPLLGSLSPPSDAGTWELSRFAIDMRATDTGRVLSLSAFTLDLLSLVLKAARDRSVRRLILTTSIGIERLMLRARLNVHRIGSPQLIDGVPCIALFIEVSTSSPVRTLHDALATLSESRATTGAWRADA